MLKIWDVLGELKYKGKIAKRGFSLYRPEEAAYLLERDIRPDMVQVPFSIFDQRFSGIFPLLKAKGVEIHARSVFLKGLIFKDPEELGEDFSGIRNKLVSLHSLSEKESIPVQALCINFALSENLIDKVVIGVDSAENLKEDIAALKYEKKIHAIRKQLSDLKEDDESIILPVNWK